MNQSPRMVLLDSRSTVGTALMFWAAEGGYTSNITKAEVFSVDEAQRQHKSRESDIPMRLDYLDARKERMVDCFSRWCAGSGTAMLCTLLHGKGALQPMSTRPGFFRWTKPACCLRHTGISSGLRNTSNRWRTGGFRSRRLTGSRHSGRQESSSSNLCGRV
jgi:hypothetical protein